MFKKILKIFGIVVLSLSVIIGATTAVLAMLGKFKPKFVALNSLSFSSSTYYINDVTEILIQANPIH